MKTEVNPQDTNRAEAFELWMSSPMPMVTLTKTFDVSNLIRASRRLGVKFTALLCWGIGKAATQSEGFYILPENGKLFQYDCIAVNVIVNNSKGGINSCDIPYTDDLKEFLHEYDNLTEQVAAECKSTFLEDFMIVGTSAMIQTELDSIVNQFTDKFCNPKVMWGRYRKRWVKTTLPISFQFHHTQMDGAHAGKFLANMQNEIIRLA